MTHPVMAVPRAHAFDAGWVAAHWRGELAPAGSFWWRFALPLTTLALAVGVLTTWINLEGSQLQAASVALLFAWSGLLGAAAWGGVGAWRAAGARTRGLGARRWSGATRIAVVLGVLGAGALMVSSLVPQLDALLSLARGIDPLGTLQVRLAPDGRRLRLQGALGEGAAALVAQSLGAAQGVYLLELDAPEGRHAQALAIADLVRARGLQTRVVGSCGNACLRVFMAGRGRQVMPGARLGLHRESSGVASPPFEALARRWQAAGLRRIGLPDAVVAKALSTSPSRPWLLETDELLAGGLIGMPGRPLDIELPARQGAQPAEYGAALTSSPAWRVFETYRAGTIATAARAMVEARALGAGDDAVQVAAQRAVEALLADLVRDAGPALREQYVVLLQGQLEAAQAAAAGDCSELLHGDAAARRALAAPWPDRESAWLLAAAAEPAPQPQRPLTELETEVVRRRLGERAPALLGAIRRTPRIDAHSSACERAAALIAEVMRLPAPERRLAIRLMFAAGRSVAQTRSTTSAMP